MSEVLPEEKKKNMLRKKKYYASHPEEAVADHLKQIKTGSDDFIMEKVEKWENKQKQ